MPVDLERRGAVALVTLNRPERLNALSVEMFEELGRHLDEVEADPDLRVVVITGAGEKAFTAGADIGHMREASPMEARAFAELGHAVTARIERLSRPVIAAVNGFALGGGCELALACDLRTAADTARLGLPEVTLGIVPGWGGTQRLARLTTLGFAKEMVLTGRHVTAAEAHAAGLVNHVHPAADLLERTFELADQIASRPAVAVRVAKRLVQRSFDGDLAGNLAHELEAFALLFATEDQREGMAAFFDKRPPRFLGR